MIEDLTAYLHQVAHTLGQLPRQPLDQIAEALWETYERDGTILICGNGGSAASASHFACDLAKLTINADCRRLRALALTDNIPLLSAWSNDQGYADVFTEQLIGLYRPGDLLFAISGSGNSPVVRDGLGDGGAWGMTLRYSYEEELLGSAGALRTIAERFPGWLDQTFALIYGDMLCDIDLAQHDWQDR